MIIFNNKLNVLTFAVKKSNDLQICEFFFKNT